jgi:hypothetical protein
VAVCAAIVVALLTGFGAEEKGLRLGSKDTQAEHRPT